MNILNTEQRNPKTTHIDKMSTFDMLKVMNDENYSVIKSVEEVIEDIAVVVDHIASKLNLGGRVIYIGAGTSGRLGIIDATECPPTYGADPDTFIGIIAGGNAAVFKASENQEDNESLGEADILQTNLTPNDTVIGISAAGGAKYVIGALNAAKKVGAKTVCLCCNKGTALAAAADLAICPDTGPEVITGSTRMKAGTAQKIILNMISTGAMIKNGRVYENYMVNIRATNIKLRQRALRIICDVTTADEATALLALEKSSGFVKEAIELIVKGSV